jgi:peptide/nickel transport system permease protein
MAAVWPARGIAARASEAGPWQRALRRLLRRRLAMVGLLAVLLFVAMA